MNGFALTFCILYFRGWGDKMELIEKWKLDLKWTRVYKIGSYAVVPSVHVVMRDDLPVCEMRREQHPRPIKKDSRRNCLPLQTEVSTRVGASTASCSAIATHIPDQLTQKESALPGGYICLHHFRLKACPLEA